MTELIHDNSQEYLFANILKKLDMAPPENHHDHSKYHLVFYLLQQHGLSMEYGYRWLGEPFSPELEYNLKHTSSLIYKTAHKMIIKNEHEVINKIKKFKENLLDEYVDDLLKLRILTFLSFIDHSAFSGKGSLAELRNRLFDVRPALKDKANIDKIIDIAFNDMRAHLH